MEGKRRDCFTAGNMTDVAYYDDQSWGHSFETAKTQSHRIYHPLSQELHGKMLWCHCKFCLSKFSVTIWLILHRELILLRETL